MWPFEYEVSSKHLYPLQNYILVFCEYVYKVKLAILGLNVNNFATGRDILMKLHIQRALYYGIQWRKNHEIF